MAAPPLNASNVKRFQQRCLIQCGQSLTTSHHARASKTTLTRGAQTKLQNPRTIEHKSQAMGEM